MRYVRVKAKLRRGEKILSTAEGRKLLAWNLGRRKARFDSKLYAVHADRAGLTLVLGLPTPARLKKIMHRVRVLTVTDYNRAHGAVGKQRWQPGFETTDVPRGALAREAAAVNRRRGFRLEVALDRPPGR